MKATVLVVAQADGWRKILYTHGLIRAAFARVYGFTNLPGHSHSFPDAMRGADFAQGKWAMAQKPKVGQLQSDTSFIAYASGGQIDLHLSMDLHSQARSAPPLAPSSESFPATRNPDPH